jgi:hypothetical protein
VEHWLTVWTLCHGGRASRFFFLQAAVPWLLSLGVSLFGGRPIFVERYLAFAQLFLLGFWGVAWARLPGPMARVFLTWLLGAVCLSGVAGAIARLPDSPPGPARAAAFLKEHAQAGDLIVVDSPVAVYRLRYYAAQAGLLAPNVRCRVNLFPGPGHAPHLAALATEDIIWPGEPCPGPVPRCWGVSETGQLGLESWPGMKLRLQRTFSGPEGEYSLALYERREIDLRSAPWKRTLVLPGKDSKSLRPFVQRSAPAGVRVAEVAAADTPAASLRRRRLVTLDPAPLTQEIGE